MGAGRVLVGVLFCIAAAILIIFFVTMGYDAGDWTELGSPALYQFIFMVMMHPYFSTTIGAWSVLAALAVGALIGGLVAKGAKSGLAVGSIVWLINFILYISISFAFNFNDMLAFWTSIGILNTILDIAISMGILMLVGAIGGALTGGGE